MRVLREAGDLVAVVHSIGSVRVEVGPVAGPNRLHLSTAFVGRIIVLVIDAEEEWVEGRVRPRDGKARDSEDCPRHCTTPRNLSDPAITRCDQHVLE